MLGITARSKPAHMSLSLIEFPLDLSDVTFKSGLDKQFPQEIKCPMDGVYFLSVSVFNYGKKLVLIYPHVSHNFKILMRLGMGAFTKDYAADDHAFIFCEKGDTVTLGYNYMGIPGIKGWTPKATITIIFIAPTGNSLQFCSK